MTASHWLFLAGMVCVAAAVVMLAMTGGGFAAGMPLSIGIFVTAASRMAERDEGVAELRREVDQLRGEGRMLRG